MKERKVPKETRKQKQKKSDEGNRERESMEGVCTVKKEKMCNDCSGGFVCMCGSHSLSPIDQTPFCGDSHFHEVATS